MCVQLDDDIISIAVVLFHFPSLFVDQKKKENEGVAGVFLPSKWLSLPLSCARRHGLIHILLELYFYYYCYYFFYSSLSLMPYVDKWRFLFALWSAALHSGLISRSFVFFLFFSFRVFELALLILSFLILFFWMKTNTGHKSRLGYTGIT